MARAGRRRPVDQRNDSAGHATCGDIAVNRSGTSQRGVALIVALLVVALAAVIIAGLLDHGELTAARTRNQLREAQALAYAQGLESYAAHVLSQDSSNGGTDTADDIWAIPLPPTPVPGGEITATMRDLDGRFNLNNLSPDQVNNPNYAIWKGKFVLLLQALKLDPAIADNVAAWMDPGSAVGDSWYLAQPVPYRSARRTFSHVSELRLVKGIDGNAYALLAPCVSALPPGSLININTASVPVLMTLSSSTPLTQQIAQALWQQGHANFTQLSDATTLLTGFTIDCGGLAPANCYGVQSSYFLARGEVALDGLTFTFFSMIERRTSAPNPGIRVIQRSRGGD
jgi:general secretion pathway protein K